MSRRPAPAYGRPHFPGGTDMVSAATAWCRAIGCVLVIAGVVAGGGCMADPAPGELAGAEAELECTPASASTSWAAGTAYAAGAQVRYADRIYRARQGHTAQVGWEPTSAPALWEIPTPCAVGPWQPQTVYP